jgi:WD40 repeat protein
VNPFAGHVGRVNAIALSSDGKTLLSGGADGTVRLWDAEKGTARDQARGVFRSGVGQVRLSGDGSVFLGVGPGDYQASWATKNPFEPRRIEAPDGVNVTCADLTPDGSLFVLATSRKVWSLRNEVPWAKVVKSRTFTGRITAVVSLGDAAHFAVAERGGSVHVWNAETDALVSRVPVQKGDVDALAYHPRMRLLAAGGLDRSILLVRLARGFAVMGRGPLSTAQPGRLEGHQGRVTSLAFSADGRRLVSGSQDRTVRIWSLGTNQVIRTFSDEEAVLGVAFAGDGQRVFSCGKKIRAWELAPKP